MWLSAAIGLWTRLLVAGTDALSILSSRPGIWPALRARGREPSKCRQRLHSSEGVSRSRKFSRRRCQSSWCFLVVAYVNLRLDPYYLSKVADSRGWETYKGARTYLGWAFASEDARVKPPLSKTNQLLTRPALFSLVLPMKQKRASETMAQGRQQSGQAKQHEPQTRSVSQLPTNEELPGSNTPESLARCATDQTELKDG